MAGSPEVQRINAQKPRRIRLTAEMVVAIGTAIRAGVRPEIAAALNGVPSTTYYDWMKKARDPILSRPMLRELQEAVELALAEWEATDVMLIGQAARTENAGEWQAAAWRLERRLPSVYGRKTKVEMDATVSTRPFIDASKLSIEEQTQLVELLRKAQPQPDELPPEGRAALELMPGTAE